MNNIMLIMSTYIFIITFSYVYLEKVIRRSNEAMNAIRRMIHSTDPTTVRHYVVSSNAALHIMRQTVLNICAGTMTSIAILVMISAAACFAEISALTTIVACLYTTGLTVAGGFLSYRKAAVAASNV